jgi:hypothetical protein
MSFLDYCKVVLHPDKHHEEAAEEAERAEAAMAVTQGGVAERLRARNAKQVMEHLEHDNFGASALIVLLVAVVLALRCIVKNREDKTA